MQQKCPVVFFPTATEFVLRIHSNLFLFELESLVNNARLGHKICLH